MVKTALVRAPPHCVNTLTGRGSGTSFKAYNEIPHLKTRERFKRLRVLKQTGETSETSKKVNNSFKRRKSPTIYR